MEKYFSTFEVARLCHVSPASVTRWVAEGKLPAGRTVGGHKRIKAGDVIHLLKSLDIALPPELTGSASEASAKSILVVDDDQALREMICRFLRKEFPEYLIEEAGDGFTAGWMAQKKHPSVILLDIKLPGIDGYGVCATIRKSEDFADTRIIATSGYGEGCREKIMDLGADDFLAKPFDWNKLKQMITHVKAA